MNAPETPLPLADEVDVADETENTPGSSLSSTVPSGSVRPRRIDWVDGVEGPCRVDSLRARVAKRVIDLVFVVAFGVVAVPAIAVAAALIHLASPGPVFYSQVRIGRGGRRFLLWKLRTMLPDAERRLEEFLEGDPKLRAEWESGHKLEEDPRIIPKIGELLRRTSVDELPQLWNVLRGEMTLVGPRPLPEYHLAKFDEWFRRYRQRVTPGVTGLWQVESRDDGRPEMFVHWDCQYIRNWSLGKDLRILMKTIVVVLGRRGAC